MSITYISIIIYCGYGGYTVKKKVQLCLNKYLDTHGISRYALAKATGIGFPIIDRYYKNQVVRYDSDVLSRIVTALDCKLCDILTIENSK